MAVCVQPASMSTLDYKRMHPSLGPFPLISTPIPIPMPTESDESSLGRLRGAVCFICLAQTHFFKTPNHVVYLLQGSGLRRRYSKLAFVLDLVHLAFFPGLLPPPPPREAICLSVPPARRRHRAFEPALICSQRLDVLYTCIHTWNVQVARA